MNSDSMTSVEDQIRAAARATALEMSDHDMPPRPDLRGRGQALEHQPDFGIPPPRHALGCPVDRGKAAVAAVAALRSESGLRAVCPACRERARHAQGVGEPGAGPRA